MKNEAEVRSRRGVEIDQSTPAAVVRPQLSGEIAYVRYIFPGLDLAVTTILDILSPILVFVQVLFELLIGSFFDFLSPLMTRIGLSCPRYAAAGVSLIYRTLGITCS